MRINSLDAYREKHKSNSQYYLLAIIGAIVLFAVLLALGSGAIWIIRLIIDKWMYALAIIVSLLVFRKLLMKKKLEVHYENPIR